MALNPKTSAMQDMTGRKDLALGRLGEAHCLGLGDQLLGDELVERLLRFPDVDDAPAASGRRAAEMRHGAFR